MEDYKIEKKREFEGTLPDKKIIYYDCKITDFHLENSTTLKECIFIHCHLKSMKIINIDQRIKLTFLNCRISDLHIEKSHFSNLRFFETVVFDSELRYSTLQGPVFPTDIPDELIKIQEKFMAEDQNNRDDKLENSTTLKRPIFINCHFISVKFINIERCIKLTFLNCRITELHIEKSSFWKLQFFKSEVFKSTFQHSYLYGIEFSTNIPKDLIKEQEKLMAEDQNNRDDKGLPWKKKKELKTVTVHQTKFIFCQLNDMEIDNTTFTHTAIKHCNLQDMKILKNVKMTNVDFRGSNFFKPDFGECHFGAVTFNKSKYFVEIINALFKIISKRIIKQKLPVKIFRETTTFRTWVKKIFYKLKLNNFADYLCSTTLINAEYGKTYFAQDIRFFWYMEDVEFVDNLKKKHPVFSSIMMVSSNNLRSFIIPLLFIVLIIFVFSMLYSTYGVFSGDGSAKVTQMLDPNGRPTNPFYLSAQVFLNCGISPLWTNDSRTRRLIMFEIILGFFFLGTILGVVVNNFLIKPKMPKRWKLDRRSL